MPANLLREILISAEGTAMDCMTQDFAISTRETQLCTSCGAESIGPTDSRFAILSLALKRSGESLQDAISRLFKSGNKKCSSNMCGGSLSLSRKVEDHPKYMILSVAAFAKSNLKMKKQGYTLTESIDFHGLTYFLKGVLSHGDGERVTEGYKSDFVNWGGRLDRI